MASNFSMIIDKKWSGLGLKLTGEFDGSTAYEMIDVLRKCFDDILKIFIHTNRLKNLFPFGRDLFFKLRYAVDSNVSRIVITYNEEFRVSLQR